jgi:hypothetical protein
MQASPPAPSSCSRPHWPLQRRPLQQQPVRSCRPTPSSPWTRACPPMPLAGLWCAAAHCLELQPAAAAAGTAAGRRPCNPAPPGRPPLCAAADGCLPGCCAAPPQGLAGQQGAPQQGGGSQALVQQLMATSAKKLDSLAALGSKVTGRTVLLDNPASQISATRALRARPRGRPLSGLLGSRRQRAAATAAVVRWAAAAAPCSTGGCRRWLTHALQATPGRSWSWDAHRLDTGGRRPTTSAAAPRPRRHSDLVPLHDAWQAYISSAVPPAGDVLGALMHADLHGAKVWVAKASNPALVGVHGIVLRHSGHALHVVDVRDRLHGGCRQQEPPGWGHCACCEPSPSGP